MKGNTGIALPVLVLLILTGFGFPVTAQGTTRIKDVTSIAGVSDKQLIGYGLIVGLNGSGDGNKSAFTINSIVSMLEKLGITVSAGDIKVKNVAAVVTTAELPPFTPPGTSIDVTVSSIGDASSLEGGQLLLTPLRGYDGITYAVAQGPVSIGGFNIDAGAGNVIRKNHTTVGRVPRGAIVKKQPEDQLAISDGYILTLDDPDYQSALNISNEINILYSMKLARALNSRTIEVTIPPAYAKNPVAFIADVGRREVSLDKRARVVINERTGTVVIGGEVGIDEVAIAHGNLQVEIKASYAVSQPMAFGEGNSIVVPEIETKVEDKEARLFSIRKSNTVSDIATALNELGVTPRDMVAIFQALKRVGALKAELVIM
ncbi:MAG: flagellar basal body P-ring protein FlgI [Candidatus Krumholzibacteriota bacterium]|nr:flagellar basal body P-ring protein FlgI [Candidatus Krumholzibacteriota bacterium]